VTTTLPPRPKALGSLRHVFASALQSVTGQRSALGYKPKQKVLVILVDGMGAENVLERAGHAPWLAQQITAGGSAFAAFPATTSTNITSFATGLVPGEHGFIGHVVRDSHFGRALNLLSGWDSTTDPESWQPHQTISELSSARGVACNVIAAEEYRTTGFTQATMRSAKFHGVDSIADRFQKALEILNSPQESITYLYISELDKFGHVHGWQSPGWALQLESIASEIDRLRNRVPADCGVVITADHGMLDSPDEFKVELKDQLSSIGLSFFGGDTRAALIYLEDPQSGADAIKRLSDSRFFSVHLASELTTWYGELGAQAQNRAADLVLLAKGQHTLFHEDFSKPRSYRMVSHHGAMTSRELKIPLIRIGL
jgi:predicted AlkP superfamily pyrophosphatase or phosphodiesterase